jgi:toxin ParE1/3/4
MPTFRLREGAEKDLIQIGVSGREQWGEAQMRLYLVELDRAFHMLAEMPSMGTPADEVKPGYRRLRQGSHLIFYRLTESRDVDIVRVLHERMDYESHLEE